MKRLHVLLSFTCDTGYREVEFYMDSYSDAFDHVLLNYKWREDLVMEFKK